MDDVVAEARPARKEQPARAARPARGFRVPLDVFRRFDQNRDRYNSERDPSTPKLTLDEQARLAFEFYLEECGQTGAKKLIDKLRAPRA